MALNALDSPAARHFPDFDGEASADGGEIAAIRAEGYGGTQGWVVIEFLPREFLPGANVPQLQLTSLATAPAPRCQELTVPAECHVETQVPRTRQDFEQRIRNAREPA